MIGFQFMVVAVSISNLIVGTVCPENPTISTIVILSPGCLAVVGGELAPCPYEYYRDTAEDEFEGGHASRSGAERRGRLQARKNGKQSDKLENGIATANIGLSQNIESYKSACACLPR